MCKATKNPASSVVIFGKDVRPDVENNAFLAVKLVYGFDFVAESLRRLHLGGCSRAEAEYPGTTLFLKARFDPFV